MRRLGVRLALAAVIAVAAGAWYHKGHQAEAAQGAVEAPIEMALAGLAVPASSAGSDTTHADASAALTPSCDARAPGACDWLQRVCADLQGAMTDNRDGALTCLLMLD